MSFDLKLGYVYLGLSGLTVFMLLALWAMRRIINHAFAKSGHTFYVQSVGIEPHCATCPFNKRCPYSDGKTCKFAKITLPATLK